VAFRADGKQLASASSDNTVKVWDLVTGQELLTLEGHSSDVCAVAFSPDGTRLATAGRDGTIKLWDAATGQEALTLRGHVRAVVSIAFSPKGDRLVSASWDGTVKVWDARPLTAEVRAEREAVGLLDFLLAKPLCKADVVEHLRTCPVSPPVRERALDLVRRYREETAPDRYHHAAWAVARQPYLNALQYGFALRQAQTACRLTPRQDRYRVTLGAALYRAGRHREAAATLAEADRLKSGAPAALAFLALAEHQLGHADKARAALGRLREVMKRPSWAADIQTRALLAETEALLRGQAHE
jgi:hypothetical protein